MVCSVGFRGHRELIKMMGIFRQVSLVPWHPFLAKQFLHHLLKCHASFGGDSQAFHPGPVRLSKRDLEKEFREQLHTWVP